MRLGRYHQSPLESADMDYLAVVIYEVTHAGSASSPIRQWGWSTPCKQKIK